MLDKKYRPTNFDDFLGNEETVEVLKGFIANKEHPHVYLFSGPSGCGKTTLARILGAGIGITIKVLGMVSRNRSAAILANRAAPTVAAYLGGGTGELVYQGADFILTRGSLNLSNGGSGFSSGGA